MLLWAWRNMERVLYFEVLEVELPWPLAQPSPQSSSSSLPGVYELAWKSGAGVVSPARADEDTAFVGILWLQKAKGQFLFIDSALAAWGFISGDLDWFPGSGFTSIVIWKHRNSPFVVPDWVRHGTPLATDCSHTLSPQLKFYILLNSWKRVFKSIQTCSCSSHMHTFCSPLGFIFSLGSAKPLMNVIERWNVPWSLRTRLKSPANTCLSSTLIHRKDVHI